MDDDGVGDCSYSSSTGSSLPTTEPTDQTHAIAIETKGLHPRKHYEMAMTGFSITEATVLRKAIEKLGGRVVRSVRQMTTHVIAKTRDLGTPKYYCAMAGGKWYLRPSFIEMSAKRGRFVAEEPHEWDQQSDTNQKTAYWRKLLNHQGAKHPRAPFKGHQAIVYIPKKPTVAEGVCRSIELGGGKVLSQTPPFNTIIAKLIKLHNSPSSSVSSPPPRVKKEKTSELAYIVLDKTPQQNKHTQILLNSSIPCVKYDFILDTLTNCNQKIIDIKTYQIK